MDYVIFQKTLFSTAIDQNKLYLYGIGIALIFIAIEMIYYKTTGDTDGFALWRFISIHKHSKPKLNHKDSIVAYCFLLILCLLMICVNIVPICLDIKHEQYIQTETVYANYADPNSKKEEVCIVVDGENVLLELPADWTETQFPIGTFDGIVWYSEESKIILDFMPTE